MRFFRTLPSLLAAMSALFLLESSANAQSVSIPSAATRTLASGGDPPAHPDGRLVLDLNYEDCVKDVRIHVPLLDTPSNSYNLEAWAGTGDCTDPATRPTSGGTPTCWRVTPDGAIDNKVAATSAEIRVRDILEKLGSDTVKYAQGTVASCSRRTETGSLTAKLYIFFHGNDDKPVGNTGTVDFTVDTRAPAAEGAITVGIGSTLLFVHVTPATDTDAKRWRVYCDPPNGSKVRPDPSADGGYCANQVSTQSLVVTPMSLTALPDGAPDDAEAGSEASGPDAGASTDATVTDAQASTDSGTSGTDASAASACGVSTSPGSCGATYLHPGGGSTTASSVEGGTSIATGTQVLVDSIFQCGNDVDIGSTTLQIGGLKNDTPYNIAVAAVDAYGNVGPLSNVACQTPQEISDFWDEYKNANGKAGGSFCALEAAGVPTEAAVFGFSVLGAALVLAKRRRRS